MVKKYIIFNSHPIQYFCPLYKELNTNGLLQSVWFGSDHGLRTVQDREFRANFKWDLDLLSGFEYAILPNISWKPGPYGFFGLINLSLFRMMREADKSIILIHGWHYFSNWLIMLSAHWFGHKIALKTETPLVHEGLRSKTRNLRRYILKCIIETWVDEVHYIGEQNRLFYKYLGIDDNILLYTPYSVDNARFSHDYMNLRADKDRIKDSLGLRKDVFYFLYVGKYIEKKRPLDLIRAYSQLPLAMRDNCGLVFVGEGALRKDMEMLIHENSLMNVHLSGFINQTAISKYYVSCDTFVMCSGEGETWGLSTNEAMNFGLPVILSDLTGSSYDLINDNGFHFKTGDISELSSALSKMLCLQNDELRKMQEKSKEIISKHSFSEIVNHMICHQK